MGKAGISEYKHLPDIKKAVSKIFSAKENPANHHDKGNIYMPDKDGQPIN